jgi:hypothetical protein
LAVKLNIQKPEDWNKVPARTVLNEAPFVANHYGSVSKGIISRMSRD